MKKEIMKKWKVNWEEKKKEILKMERLRIDETREYQGQWVGGQAEGLGVLFFLNEGSRFEGYIKKGQMDGKGLYFLPFGLA